MVVTTAPVLPNALDLIEQRNSEWPGQAVWRPTVGEHSIQVVRRPVHPDDRKSSPPDPERSRREGQRRARIVVRRWCVHNQISRLLTLTFAGEHGVHDRDAVLRHLRAFFRLLGSHHEDIKYLYSLELHPGGHGYHVHIGVDRYLSKDEIRSAWPHGYIDIRRLKVKSARGKREQWRAVARYIAKYACKAEDEGRQAGRHRYERTQGHNPTEHRFRASMGALSELFRERGAYSMWSWDSAFDDQWCGPRTIVFRE